MKRTLFLLFILVTALSIKAQGILDIYDFSSSFYQGTAKSAAMGNAMGAVGQDFSSISINPAGLGLYRHSTLMITPGLYISNGRSTFNGSYASDTDVRMPINDVGAVFTFPKYSGALKSFNFGVGMNRINNFTEATYSSGTNKTSSLVDAYFLEMANGNVQIKDELYVFAPNTIYPLWETYVIGEDASNLYTTVVPQGNLNQQGGVIKRGYTNELSLSFGFNFDDKWFLGAALDIPRLYRRLTNDYKETNLSSDPTFRNFNYWMQTSVMASNGWGIGGKFGFIGFPVRWLRLGVSFHTPTFYTINEEWTTNTYSQFKSGSYSYGSPLSSYRYKLTTPFRFDASAAFILGNMAMISFDYELVNYKNCYVSDRSYDYSFLNNNIVTYFKTTSNFRVGGEYRVKNVCFRAGYAFYGSPYGISESKLRVQNISAGVGFTVNFFTLDIAYVYSNKNNTYYVYDPYTSFVPAGDDVVANTVNETINNHGIFLTFKFKLK